MRRATISFERGASRIVSRTNGTALSQASPTRSRGHLLQVLGTAFGLAVIVGNTIGAGILRTPGEIAARLPNESWILAVWIAGGLYALAGAFSLAEVGAMVPRSGGQYVFVRRALGEYPAFVVGWSDWIASSGSIAAIAIVIGESSARLVPALAGRETLVATGVVLVFALAQARGVRVADAVQQTSSLVKALCFALLIGACFVLPASFGTPEPARSAMPEGAALAAALVLALQSVIYAYDGWTGVLYFGEEVREPGRDIPRSMIGGVLVIGAIYVFVNVAMLHVLGVERMAGDAFVAGTAASALLGEHGEAALHAMMILSMLSSVNALLLMTSRVPVALGRDGLLPRAFERVSAAGTPLPSLAASTLVALAFLATGTFSAVLAVLSFFFVASYALSLTSVFVLRRREPDAPRPYRAFGYPWTPLFALLVSLAFLAGSVVSDWTNSRVSLLLLAVTLPVFWLVRRGPALFRGRTRE
jgi:APA family basic amino acid/polyamine antiporter